MGKIPLENPPLERAVVGALLEDTTRFWLMKDRARPDLFTVPVHGRIVEIVHKLTEEGREISAPSILSRMPQGDSDWSPEGYLATLIGDAADADLLDDYFGDLEDMWARRQMAKLGSELIRQSTDDSGLDAMGRLDAAKERIDSLNDPMGTSVHHVRDIAHRLLASVSESAGREETVGIECGIKGVQDLVGSLMPGRLYLVAGPPGSGKSALAYQIGAYAAQTTPVFIEEIEMEGEELVERDLAGRTGISADSIERASLNEEEIDKLFAASDELSKLHLYIDSSTSPTVAQIRAKAMRMQRLKGLGLVVIDHLLYLSPPDRRLGEFEGIRKNLQALKKMAKDLGIPVMVLSQLKAGYGDGTWKQIMRPNVGNLYGGSAVEQESDVILFVHREEYLLERKEPDENAPDRAEWVARFEHMKGKAELVLAKRRGGKGTGIRTVYFEGAKTRFTDQRPRLDYRTATRGEKDLMEVAETF